MRFAFVSHEGSGLPFWLRLLDEGHEVMAYIPDRGTSFIHRETGRNLVPIASSITDLRAWGYAKPTVFVFDCSEEGEIAEGLRAHGKFVIGGGAFCDKLEMDRHFGSTIAEECGMNVPTTHKFPTISAALAHLKKHDQDWYFKTDDLLATSMTSHGEGESLGRRLEAYRDCYGDGVKNILQETIEGPDISTACWWNGSDWIPPFEGTIENKKLMNDDVGPATGCAFNIVWWYDNFPKIATALCFEKLGEVFRREKAPPGIYDINALLSKDGVYFLEHTPRFGYDAEPTAMRGLQGDLGEFYYNLARGTAAFAPFDITRSQMSVRVSIPPYPWEQLHELPSRKRARASGAVGVPVGGIDPTDRAQLYAGSGEHFMAYGLGLRSDGQLICVDPTGIIGLVCADGVEPEEMNETIVDFIKDDLDIPDVQYRTDAGSVLDGHLQKIRDLGYELGVLT